MFHFLWAQLSESVQVAADHILACALLGRPVVAKGLPVAALGAQLPFEYYPYACWAFACKRRGSTLLQERPQAGQSRTWLLGCVLVT